MLFVVLTPYLEAMFKGNMLLFCVNKLWWSCLHWYIVPGFAVVSLLSCCVHCLQGHTAQTPTGPLWGGCPFGFSCRVAVLRPNILLSTPPSINPPELTWMASSSMPGIMCVWQIYGGLNRVYFPQRPCVHMRWCKGRCIGQLKYWRHWEGCHFAVIQNSDTSMGLGSSLFLSFALVVQVHHCQLGALHLCSPCWLTWSTLGQMVCTVLRVN